MELGHVNLRLEEALRQQLIVLAKAAERSLNKEIVHRLRRSIEQAQPDKD
jgi:predicted HicB family RNase H-like nuclease